MNKKVKVLCQNLLLDLKLNHYESNDEGRENKNRINNEPKENFLFVSAHSFVAQTVSWFCSDGFGREVGEPKDDCND